MNESRWKEPIAFCRLCNAALYSTEAGAHTCKPYTPEDIPAEERRPANSSIGYTNLSMHDKDQLDRIETKIDRLIGLLSK